MHQSNETNRHLTCSTCENVWIHEVSLKTQPCLRIVLKFSCNRNRQELLITVVYIFPCKMAKKTRFWASSFRENLGGDYVQVWDFRTMHPLVWSAPPSHFQQKTAWWGSTRFPRHALPCWENTTQPLPARECRVRKYKMSPTMHPLAGSAPPSHFKQGSGAWWEKLVLPLRPAQFLHKKEAKKVFSSTSALSHVYHCSQRLLSIPII